MFSTAFPLSKCCLCKPSNRRGMAWYCDMPSRKHGARQALVMMFAAQLLGWLEGRKSDKTRANRHAPFLIGLSAIHGSMPVASQIWWVWRLTSTWRCKFSETRKGQQTADLFVLLPQPEPAFEEENQSRYPHLLSVRLVRSIERACLAISIRSSGAGYRKHYMLCFKQARLKELTRP